MAELAHPWLARIIESEEISALLERLDRDGHAIAQGSLGSSSTLVAASLAIRSQRPVLLVVAHLDEADDALDDLQLLRNASHDLSFDRFGAMEVLPGESAVSLELLAERLDVVGRLLENRGPNLLIAPIQALMQPVPRAEAINTYSTLIHPGDLKPPDELLSWLIKVGYALQDAIEQPGDCARRGGILDIYPPAGTLELERSKVEADSIGPIRLDYFGDQIESISRIDPDTLGSLEHISAARIIGAQIEQIQNDEHASSILDLLPVQTTVVLHELMELTEQARGYYERLTNPRGIYPANIVLQSLHKRPHVQLNQYTTGNRQSHEIQIPVAAIDSFHTEAHQAIQELADLSKPDHHRVFVLCQKPAERDRLNDLIQEHTPEAQETINIEVGYLHRGFVWEQQRLGGLEPSNQGASQPKESKTPEPRTQKKGADAATTTVETLNHFGLASPLGTSAQSLLRFFFIPHHELFHRYDLQRRVRRVMAAAGARDAFFDLNVGDCVVHVDHGIARFTGLNSMRRGGMSQEFLTLEFAQNARLHVPVSQIDLIQKYVGGFQGKPPLSVIGGKRWSKQKQAVSEAVKSLATELLRVQAARTTMPGIRYPDNTSWQNEFEAEFPYEETEDQLTAIAAVKHDMIENRPMDRLICGDVGFGKTEVAIRAAFKAVESGRQVAVLVPTTVLAEQHERTFHQRLADYPFRVASLSRFKTGTEQARTLKGLKAGQVDIVIGTHRLLSKDVQFADLGLVVIDEEQRFGVEHKQKLLEFRLTADVLTLTATPIPRTLHMAMVGLRDISSLSTPPLDRRAIVTEVLPFNEQRIKQALIRELNRDGQAYFVHNRVHNIRSFADQIQGLLPEARIVIGHGQMPTRELERVMQHFIRHEADILVSTTIIESGIDIANANTMFINNADPFGLADLHQLRGRVGRYKHRAYCYLLLPQDRPISDFAAKRLKAIEQFTMLGAGFKIAMKDLEIRGAGNLLGSEQSGHIAAVGYEMYCMLLDQEAKKLRQEPIIEPAKTHLELSISGTLPKPYISSDKHRMEAYRRLSRCTCLKELASVVKDLEDAYGPPPTTAKIFICLVEIRVAATLLSIDRIKLDGPDLIFKAKHASQLEKVFRNAAGRTSVIDCTTFYYRPPPNRLKPPDTLLMFLRKRLLATAQEQCSE